MTDLGPVRRFLELDVEKHDSGYALYQAKYKGTHSLLMLDMIAASSGTSPAGRVRLRGQAHPPLLHRLCQIHLNRRNYLNTCAWRCHGVPICGQT